MVIGIIGMGVVGKALYAYYRQDHDVYTYDKATDDEAVLSALNKCAHVVFICVGTPYAGDGKGLDCSQVHAAVDVLSPSTAKWENTCGVCLKQDRKQEKDKPRWACPAEDIARSQCDKIQSIKKGSGKTIIIKSTVMPGTTDAIATKHPEHHVFYIPEFLSEKTAEEDYANPRRGYIIGTTLPHDSYDKGFPIELLPDFEKVSVQRLPAYQAELLKLATNAFYALKVTFANQLFDAGVKQATLYALGDDPWIGNDHMGIWHKNYRGYNGACLPKDSEALVDFIGNTGSSVLLDAMQDYNDNLLTKNVTG